MKTSVCCIYLFTVVFYTDVAIADGHTKKLFLRHGYTYVNATQSFYKYFPRNVCWFKAKSTCESERATLFYPRDVTELNGVKQSVLKGKNKWLWLGISRKNNEFQTVNGQSLWDVYHNWAEKEPNNVYNSEHCIVLENQSKLNDYHCNALLPFICKLSLSDLKRNMPDQNLTGGSPQNKTSFGSYKIEISKSVPDETNNYNILSSINDNFNYTYIASTQSLYKYYTNEAPWFDATKQCESEGATLFYPKDEKEAGTVIQFSNSTEYWAPWIWTGIFYCEKQRIYKTIDDRSIEVIYGNRSPTPSEDRTGCASLQNDGTLFIMKCDNKLPYICKKGLPKSKPSNIKIKTMKNEKAVDQIRLNYETDVHNNQIVRKSVDFVLDDGNIQDLRQVNKEKPNLQKQNETADNAKIDCINYRKICLNPELQKLSSDSHLQVMMTITKAIQQYWSKILKAVE